MVLRRRDWLLGLAASACAARLGDAEPVVRDRALRVLTLNLAHGRSRVLVQSSARPRSWYRHNLEVIAAVLRREAADVVALQEAELGSRWAGDFDHVAWLAHAADYPHRVAHAHVEQPHRRYGTALLSRLPVLEASGAPFEVQGRWTKGWSRITVPWGDRTLDLVSVHLDFARASVRWAQTEELTQTLAPRAARTIVMGDFNADANDPPLALLEARLGLVKRQARAATFPSTGRRLDWILIPASATFVRQITLHDRISDHRAVVADVAFDPRG